MKVVKVSYKTFYIEEKKNIKESYRKDLRELHSGGNQAPAAESADMKPPVGSAAGLNLRTR